MKTSFLTKTFAAIAFLAVVSCSDNDTGSTQNFADNVKTSADIDEITDDISNIIENQYYAQSTGGRSANDSQSDFLPDCATITSSVTGNNWQRTITFSADGCQLDNGNILSGTIIISGTNDFDAMQQTVNYSFDNFYHNNRHIEGNRYVVRVAQNENGNPQSTINLDMQVTFPDGTVVTRTGTRVREWVAGVDTPFIALDNQYLVTGTWTTNFPNATQTAEVTSPLRIKLSCPHIVSGTINITRNNNNMVLDYGDGNCDNQATVSINGGAATTIMLGN